VENSTPSEYAPTCSIRRLVELQTPGTGRREAGVTGLENTKVLGINGKNFGWVPKELCYRKAETLGDAEEAARWWRYNLVR
jgi:hypothetical protein